MPTEQTQLTIFVLTGIILAAAVLLAVYRRRRRRDDASDDGDPTLSAFRDSHPRFYEILQAFQRRHDLAEILSDRDVREAYKVLQQRNGATRPRAGSSPLQLGDAAREVGEEQIQAAMLTILRAIYMDRRLAADLGPRARQELDRFLENVGS